MSTVDLFGLPFDNLTLDETVDRVECLLRAGEQGLVLTPNTDHIVKLARDGSFRWAYERAVLIVPDGAPVVLASRLLGKPLKSRVPGSALLPALCERAARRGWRIFFLGGRPGVAYRAASRLTAQFPSLSVTGTYSPPFGFELDEDECKRIVEMIRVAEPDILFVGVGAPKQEKWSAAYFDELNVPLICCTGAAFDFAAGSARRAPRWMQIGGIEWLYRLLQEPRRLWRRYLVDSVGFIPIVASEWRRTPKRRPQR